MKRKILSAIAAAAAVAAIVALTTGASAGTARQSGPADDGFAAFISCLASHGVHVPSDDPAAVKQWLGEHSQDDPAVRAALEACTGPADTGGGKKGGGNEGNGTDPGPTPAQVVACLERHHVDVPNDVKQTPDALKPWLAGVFQQPSVRAALDDCTGAGRG